MNTSLLLEILESGSKFKKPPIKIALIDFLNLARNTIKENLDAKFQSVEDLINCTTTIANYIKKLYNYDQIYLVIKFFKFESLSHTDVSKIILWSFCRAIPEWQQKVHLVLSNGINENDKGKDDRALFVLYNEFIKTYSSNVILDILSDDNFKDICEHILRCVILNFYYPKNIGSTWETSNIIWYNKSYFELKKENINNSYTIFQPTTQQTKILTM